jgi:hypothetical protein
MVQKGLQAETILKLANAMENLRLASVSVKSDVENSVDRVVENMGIKSCLKKRKLQFVTLIRRAAAMAKSRFGKVTWETVCSQLRRMAENKKEKLDRKKSV